MGIKRSLPTKIYKYKEIYHAIWNKSQWGKFKKSLGASAETSRNKKYVAGPLPEAKGVKYISAGAPTGIKKVKDA